MSGCSTLNGDEIKNKIDYWPSEYENSWLDCVSELEVDHSIGADSGLEKSNSEAVIGRADRLILC